MPASLADVQARIQQRRDGLEALKAQKLQRRFQKADRRAQEVFELGRSVMRRGSLQDIERGL